MFGVQKLWDSKDERAWVHDRFEEMNLQDAQNHEVLSFQYSYYVNQPLRF